MRSLAFDRAVGGGRTENFTAAAAELGMTLCRSLPSGEEPRWRLGSPFTISGEGPGGAVAARREALPALSTAFDTIEGALATHREEDESC